jgi:hypothetical protein
MLIGGLFHVFLSSMRAESSTSALNEYLNAVSHKCRGGRKWGEEDVGKERCYKNAVREERHVLCSSGESFDFPQQLVVLWFVSGRVRIIS